MARLALNLLIAFNRTNADAVLPRSRIVMIGGFKLPFALPPGLDPFMECEKVRHDGIALALRTVKDRSASAIPIEVSRREDPVPFNTQPMREPSLFGSSEVKRLFEAFIPVHGSAPFRPPTSPILDAACARTSPLSIPGKAIRRGCRTYRACASAREPAHSRPSFAW